MPLLQPSQFSNPGKGKMRKDVRGESGGLQYSLAINNINTLEALEIFQEPLDLNCWSGQWECDKRLIVLTDRWRGKNRLRKDRSGSGRSFGLSRKKGSHHGDSLLCSG
jgi:hypothetical protein